jgi:hypothetical protein
MNESDPMKKIRDTSPTLPVIRDTSPTLPLVDPAQVAAALGAEPTPVTLSRALSPLTLYAVRAELFRRLQSSGGRPALADTSRRAKIPLADADWVELEQLAATIAGPEGTPSAGQVGSVLLSMAIRSVRAELDKAPSSAASIANELTSNWPSAPRS